MHSRIRSPENRTDPPPLWEWCPLVILRSPSAALGVQHAGADLAPRRRSVGSSEMSGSYWDSSSDEMSQTLIVLSSPLLTIRFPSGLKLTLLTKSSVP